MSDASFYGKHWAEIKMRKTDDLEGIFALIDDYAPGTEVVDLMGGFGRVAIGWSKRGGHPTTVVDRSADLIDVGKQLAAREGVEVKFIEADVVSSSLSALLPGRCDALICAHYALNEILEDVHPVMRNVRAVLREGGIAVFDVLPDVMYHRFDQWEDLPLDGDPAWRVRTLVTPQGQCDSRRHRVQFRYSRRNDGTSFECHVDRRIWTSAEMDTAATAAGLRLISPASQNGRRVYRRL